MKPKQRAAIAYAIKDLRNELDSRELNPDNISEVLERLEETFPAIAATVDQFEEESEKWQKSPSTPPKSILSLELWEPQNGFRAN